MREMRREPEVPEEKVPVGECLDGPARTTSKELAPIHTVKKFAVTSFRSWFQACHRVLPPVLILQHQ